MASSDQTSMEIDNEGQNLTSDGQMSPMTSVEGQTGLVCIEYPGVVINPERAVKTLGGLHNIGNP